MATANFDSGLISDSTPANLIDDKMMELLTQIVNVLSDSAGWGPDNTVLKPLFEWYESETAAGYFSTLRLRGTATANGVRIRDMANSEEYRITAADVSGTPTIKIQHYSGTEVDSPSWTDVLKIDATKIVFPGAFEIPVGQTGDDGNIQHYIDAIAQEIYDYIGQQTSGVAQVTAAAASGLVITPTTGNVVIDFEQGAERDAGSSWQVLDGAGNCGWAGQALPAHAAADGTDGTFDVVNNTWCMVSMTNIGVQRGGLALSGGGIDIVESGSYLVTATVNITNTPGNGVVTYQASIRDGSSHKVGGYLVCADGQWDTITVTWVISCTTSSNINVALYQNEGATKTVFVEAKISVAKLS